MFDSGGWIWSVPTAPVNFGFSRLSPGHRTTKPSFLYSSLVTTSFRSKVRFFILRILVKVELEDDGESRPFFMI